MNADRILSAAARPTARAVVGWAMNPALDWRRRRVRQNVLRAIPPARGVLVERTRTGERLVPDRAVSGSAILYLHGGGYAVGSAAGYRHLTSRLARATGRTVWAPDYPLAPEHPFPAALQSVVEVYGWLARGSAVTGSADRIAVAGDSAGAGLAIALCDEARAAGLPEPAALGLISPWIDLSHRTAAARPASPGEAFLTPEFLDECAAAYAEPSRREDPRVSPILADLARLPPVVLDTASDDLIVADGLRLRDALHAAGRPVNHRHHRDLWHVFQLLAGLLPVATRAVTEFGQRLAAAMDGRDPGARPG